MKAVLFLLILFLFIGSVTATAQKRRSPDSIDVVIRLNENFISNAPVDSVFVFFDRYDHTGAGVIKQVCYPKNNKIFIPQVPEGRYFIAVYCLGAHFQYFSDITFINRRHSSKLEFDLKHSQEFTPGMYTSGYDIDFSKLSVTDARAFRR